MEKGPSLVAKNEIETIYNVITNLLFFILDGPNDVYGPLFMF